jgi:Xaa-Pro aminopeptidase
MFETKIYIQRRNILKSKFKNCLILFLGNDQSPINYLGNTYTFRQDSSFLYYFGLNLPNMVGLLDLEENKDYLFGYEYTVNDIIWMGKQPTLAELANRVGIENFDKISNLKKFLNKKIKSGLKVHFLPLYRGEQKLKLAELLDENPFKIGDKYSKKLVEAVIEQRSVKSDEEIAEIEYALEIAYQMHLTAMKMSKPGIIERDIVAALEGISRSLGEGLSFQPIVSKNGHILHNHFYDNQLQQGDLLVCDAGAQSHKFYASDITRTIPVGGKFSSIQKDIYEIVLTAQKNAINSIKPGAKYVDVHLIAAKIIAAGLIQLGIMKGNPTDAVKNGAHALFFPHGLGHMLGLDVHDMEGLGEEFVGYDKNIKRSDQFGLSFLRFAKELKPGFILTVEPGIYFIPELIDQWQAKKKLKNFINYDKLQSFKNFGGIRIEDNVLVTETSFKVLGPHIPKEAKAVEEMVNNNISE